jgi:glycerophosphoryl diester phosphodiesterase
MPLLLSPIDRWRAPPPDPARVGWIGQATFAHRGLHGAGLPENSPSAFAAAIERGLGIECDIQRSSDGQAMVFHDWELERLTGETGPVIQRTAAELEAMALTGSTDTIPRLSALLAQVGGRVPLLIEVKSRKDMRIGPVCLAVRRALEGYRGDHAVMSFDPRIPRWFAHHAPATVRGLVVTEEGSRTGSGTVKRHMAMWHARAQFLAYDIRDLPSAFPAAQRRRGLPVATWTVRSAEQRAVAAAHADAPIAEGAGVA